jgi:uncharacterized membrane protein required for colicin V production
MTEGGPSTLNPEVLTMGLDVALGVIILSGALRGWFRGFTAQAVRLMGLVSCVYLALPVRDQVRPYILAKLPAIHPDKLDRILWWVSAVVSYLVLVGLVSLALQLMKSPPAPGAVGVRRGDRLGGFLLGAAKAAVIAAFLAAGVEKYGADLARNVSWADRQVDGSYALAWTAQYQPVPRLWATSPVRNFVQQIQRNGMNHPAEADSEKQLAERDEADSGTSYRPPRLDLPPAEAPLPETQGDLQLDAETERALEEIQQELRSARPNL